MSDKPDKQRFEAYFSCGDSGYSHVLPDSKGWKFEVEASTLKQLKDAINKGKKKHSVPSCEYLSMVELKGKGKKKVRVGSEWNDVWIKPGFAIFLAHDGEWQVPDEARFFDS